MTSASITIDFAEYERLLESQRVLRTLFQNLPVMIYRRRLDADRSMEFVSHGCLALTGYQRADLTSGRISYTSLIDSEDRQRVLDGIDAALRQQTAFDLTYCFRDAAGERRWGWEQGQGVFNDGELLAIEGFVIDVTERASAYELLEERVEERTRELRTLLDASRVIGSTLDLNELFERVFDQAQQIVDFTGAVIVLREQGEFIRRATRYPDGERPLEPLGDRYGLDPGRPFRDAMLRGEPLVIDDVLDDTALARAWRELVGDQLATARQHVRSWMSVPMWANEEVVGFISFTHREPGRYTLNHIALIAAIANHVATAIENARLHRQARKLAAVEERQRLARELHDSVSQALYGISLGAQTARTLLERDPAEVGRPLDYVVELAQAGLAEMRALIFELRPESLQSEGLVVALDKQASAVRARQRLPVDVTLCPEPDWLSLDAKEALFRIAQESMHNIVKHARARWIGLRLNCTVDGVVLEVVDDGAGFDAGGSFPGHLGLISMRERMAQVGGSLTIESEPGSGTTVRAELRRPA